MIKSRNEWEITVSLPCAQPAVSISLLKQRGSSSDPSSCWGVNLEHDGLTKVLLAWHYSAAVSCPIVICCYKIAMLWEIVPPTKGRFAVGETCFLLEGGCGRADANGDNFDILAISFVSLFGDV